MLADALSEADCARNIAIFINGLASSVIHLACLPMAPPRHSSTPSSVCKLFAKASPQKSLSSLHLVVEADKEFPLAMFISFIDIFRTFRRIFLVLPSLVTSQSTWLIPDPFIA